MTTLPPRASSDEPVEERLAARIEERLRLEPRSTAALVTLLHTLGRYDRAAYRTLAETSTPTLDEPLRMISDAANYSRPWFATAGILAALGGSGGRRAAVAGVVAIGVTSFVVNQPMKLAGGRHRPERVALGVPRTRWVPMPSTTSFPSGHSASAAAFAVAVGDLVPALRLPLRGAAAVVAFSRVYTGVHYPGDVVVGAIAGAVAGRLTSRAVRRLTGP